VCVGYEKGGGDGEEKGLLGGGGGGGEEGMLFLHLEIHFRVLNVISSTLLWQFCLCKCDPLSKKPAHYTKIHFVLGFLARV